MNEDILTHGETMSEEQLLEGLRKTPKLKRRLVMRVAADLLESEAFLEAYPHLETEEQIKTALTRLLHKNKVSTIDGRRMAAELAESYEGMYSRAYFYGIYDPVCSGFIVTVLVLAAQQIVIGADTAGARCICAGDSILITSSRIMQDSGCVTSTDIIGHSCIR